MNLPSEGFAVLYISFRGIEVVLQENAHLRRLGPRSHCTKDQKLFGEFIGE